MMCYTVSAFKTYKASLIFLLRAMSAVGREDVALKCVTRNTSTAQIAVLDTFLRRRVTTPSFDSLSDKLLSTRQESFGGKVCLGAKDNDGFWSKSSGGNAGLSEVVIVLCWLDLRFVLRWQPLLWLVIHLCTSNCIFVLSCFTICVCCQIVCWLFFFSRITQKLQNGFPCGRWVSALSRPH